MEVWLGDQVGSLTAWVNFWPFFIVIVDKCLAPRGAQATSRGVQALYDEVVDEVHITCVHTYISMYQLFVCMHMCVHTHI